MSCTIFKINMSDCTHLPHLFTTFLLISLENPGSSMMLLLYGFTQLYWFYFEMSLDLLFCFQLHCLSSELSPLDICSCLKSGLPVSIVFASFSLTVFSVNFFTQRCLLIRDLHRLHFFIEKAQIPPY